MQRHKQTQGRHKQMGLIDQIRSDLNSIITNSNDFGVTLLFENPNTSPAETATIIGTGRHINLQFDEMGMVKAYGSNATCTVSEAALIAANYTYKNTDGNIDFNRHRVTMTDATSTGIYQIKTWIPNRNLGIISFELSDFE